MDSDLLLTFGDRLRDEVSSAEAEDPGGLIPLGKELPFFRTNPSVGVPSALVPVPALFMLLIMSRTELFLPASPEAEVVTEPEVVLFVSPLPLTEVISPDFRSTPTIDQGRGFGRGLGFGAEVAGEISEF